MRIVPINRGGLATLDPIRSEIDRLINSPLSRWSSYVDRDISAMPINMWDDKDNIYVETDMPGMESKDIKVNLRGDTLVISAKREESSEEKEKDYYLCERFTGSMSREVELPTSVDASKINADYKSGVLKVTLPKKDTGNREIQINVK